MRVLAIGLGALVLLALVPSGSATHACRPVAGGVVCLLDEHGDFRIPLLASIATGGNQVFVVAAHGSAPAGDAFLAGSVVYTAPASGGGYLSQYGYTLGSTQVLLTWSWGGVRATDDTATYDYRQVIVGPSCTEELTLVSSATGTHSIPPGPCVVRMPNVARTTDPVFDLL